MIGVGEAGKEAVLPLSELWSNMRQIVDGVMQQRGGQLAAAVAGGGAYDVYNTYNAPEMQAPEVVKAAGQNGETHNISITSNPTIYVEGEKPGDLEAKLEQNNRRLLQEVEELLDKKDDDERRSRYD